MKILKLFMLIGLINVSSNLLSMDKTKNATVIFDQCPKSECPYDLCTLPECQKNSQVYNFQIPQQKSKTQLISNVNTYLAAKNLNKSLYDISVLTTSKNTIIRIVQSLLRRK